MRLQPSRTPPRPGWPWAALLLLALLPLPCGAGAEEAKALEGGFQWALLGWMVATTALGAWAWNRIFKPRIPWPWALLLLTMNLAVFLPALQPGKVLGPLDTSVPRAPWANQEDLEYISKGGALNDVTLMLVPWQVEARRQLLAGQAPLLNPYSAAGQALLANGQSAPFSLSSLYSLPFDPATSQVLRAYVKTLLALWATFAAALLLGCRPAAALVAAVGYAFAGCLAVYQLFPVGEVMALFPLLFVAAERLLAPCPRRRDLALFAAALAAVLLAGHPESALFACLALAGRWLWALVANRFRRPQRAAVGVALLLSLSTTLATSFFTLPLLANALGSFKFARQGQGEVARSLPEGTRYLWAAAANHAVPGAFGTPQRSQEAGPIHLPWLAEGAVGLVCIVLAVGGIAGRRRWGDGETFLLACAVAAFTLHLNPGGISSRLLSFPVLSALAPRFAAYLGGFCLAILAALGLQAWLEGHPHRRLALAMPLALAGAFAAVLAVRPGVLRFLGGLPLDGDLLAQVAAEARFHWGIALAVLAGLGAALTLARCPFPGAATAAGLLAGALAFAQLWIGYGRYTPIVPASTVYPELEIVAAMRQEQSPFRLIGTRGVFGANSSTVYGLFDARSHDPAESARYVDWLVDLVDLDPATWKKQYRRPQPEHEPFLRLLGVKFLIAGADLPLLPPWQDRGVFRLVRLWEHPEAVRWAFFPRRVVAAGSPREARERIRPLRDPFELASIEGSQDLPETAPVANGEAAVGSVAVRDQRLEIEVTAREDAWLVVSQAALPGWRARIDGAPAPTAIADGALLAVRVPAGSRHLGLVYRPLAWTAGLALSALGLLSLCALLLRLCRRGREGAAPLAGAASS